MTESKRPRHSLDDDGYDEAFALDDEQEYTEDFRDSEYEPELGAEDGSYAASQGYERRDYSSHRRPSHDDDYEARHAAAAANSGEGSGLPLRGLAMILLAVAIVLIAWGGFSLFGGDKDNGSHTAQEQSSGNESSAQGGQSAGQEAPSSSAHAEASEEGKPGVEGKQGAQHGSSAAQPNSGNSGEAQGQGTVNKDDTQVTILNNSPVQGLANQTADKLKAQQWHKTNYGNLPDTSGAFSESVVLYPANDKNSKAAAEEIAKELGIKAEERNAETDKLLADAHVSDGSQPGKVIVVTTNSMPR